MAKRHPMESSVAVIALALAAMPLALSDAAEAADALLSGAIASAAGEKLGGVTVSAKAAGQTITTTVFTDETGNYYFPPLPTGTYRVWAQALTFATAKSEVDLGAEQAPGFHARPAQGLRSAIAGRSRAGVTARRHPRRPRGMKNARAQQLHRLPHAELYACSTSSTRPAGRAIIDLMKHVNVSGVYRRSGAQAPRRARPPSEGARGLSGAGARTRRDLDEDQVAAAPDRGRPRGSCSRNTTCRCSRTLNMPAKYPDHRRQRLVARHAVAPRLARA